MAKYFFIILLPYLAINCTAYKYTLPSDEGIKYLKQNQEFKDIVLGIDRKTEYESLINDDSLWAYTPLVPIEEIIAELQKSEIFKEVNFEDELENKPNILLTSFLGVDSQIRECVECLITAASLGIIPRIFRFDREFDMKFQSVSQGDEMTVNIRTNLKYTDAVGWVFGIVRISSKWHKDYDENNYYYSVYNELFMKKEEIINLSKVE